MRPHVVLLGDSILDNAAYVPGEPAVIDQLGSVLGDHGSATLLARDGAVCEDVAEQVRAVPADATHLVVSVGGNDALGHIGLLDRPVRSSREVFAELAAVHAEFRQGYAAMLASVQAAARPVVCCTIYDSNYESPKKHLADAALTVFNDVILRCARTARVPVIDLRAIFRSRADYANPIEPSARGGRKLAAAIAAICEGYDFTRPRTELIG
ncbi:MAG: SGNH/GDSL hydrolase family protein [bacterium]|nr:SGNH/GDSL hydrolase family protein [bacterium]